MLLRATLLATTFALVAGGAQANPFGSREASGVTIELVDPDFDYERYSRPSESRGEALRERARRTLRGIFSSRALATILEKEAKEIERGRSSLPSKTIGGLSPRLAAALESRLASIKDKFGGRLDSKESVPVPEPGTGILLGLALGGLAMTRRR